MTSSGSARVDSRQRGLAVVHPHAPPRYIPPARSAAPAGRNSVRLTSADALSSRCFGRQDRSARDAAKMHSIAGGPPAPPAPLPDGRGSSRASLRAPHLAPRPRSAVRPGATRPSWRRRACRSSAARRFCAGSSTEQPPCSPHPSWRVRDEHRSRRDRLRSRILSVRCQLAAAA